MLPALTEEAYLLNLMMPSSFAGILSMLFRGIHPGVGLVLHGSFFQTQSRRDIFKMADAVHVPLKSKYRIHLLNGLRYQPVSEFRAGLYPTKSRCLSYILTGNESSRQ